MNNLSIQTTLGESLALGFDETDRFFSKSEALNNHVFVTCIGVKELFPQTRIVFINGILNTRRDASESALKISMAHGNNYVHCICDETQGFCFDAIDVFALLNSETQLGSVKKVADVLKKLLCEMGEEGQLLIYAHSRGGLKIKRALAEFTKEEKSKTSVKSFGSPAFFTSNDCKEAENITHTCDLIPYMNPARWAELMRALPGRIMNAPWICEHQFSGAYAKSTLDKEHGFLQGGFLKPKALTQQQKVMSV